MSLISAINIKSALGQRESIYPAAKVQFTWDSSLQNPKVPKQRGIQQTQAIAWLHTPPVTFLNITVIQKEEGDTQPFQGHLLLKEEASKRESHIRRKYWTEAEKKGALREAKPYLLSCSWLPLPKSSAPLSYARMVTWKAHVRFLCTTRENINTAEN